MGNVLSGQDYTVNDNVPSVTAHILKLQKDRLSRSHFQSTLQQGHPI